MAKIVTETVIVQISRLIKDDSVPDKDGIVTPDILAVIEATTEQALSEYNTIIEVQRLSSDD